MSAYKQSLEAFVLELQGKDRIEGRLGIKVQSGTARYFHVVNGLRLYLPKSEIKKITALAQQDYELELIKACKETIRILERCLDFLSECKDPDEVYNELSPAIKKHVKWVRFKRVNSNKWMNRHYPSRLGFGRNEPVIHARNGLRVRSKTEEIIVNLFLDYGIPFLYEYPMLADGELVFPDFRVLNVRTGKEYIYEHFGRMDDPRYVESNMMRKLSLYQKEGIFMGDKLLATFETLKTPLDELYLVEFIKHFFL